ncbi:hypothetical protein V495_07544 [Pseudogymnoascus sp. VKM F-4514 (FW-929)]|nr:hypothetical protein V490_08052 [Pseudogymnoascus sp. VKM F-3557]KFY36851.1 hypothetical protein V495_07544 [Pseudogymnoascus sp. VKM F-4514 (FW-929)]KFY56684.1 hypothetical protein V497_06101 [Pseudogymnoascus sp. VKM F-4516 (FW-969)]
MDLIGKITPLALRSAMGNFRDAVAESVEHADFFATGQIGTKDFEAAGDYLTTRFPSWQWYQPTTLTKPVNKLDPTKHILKYVGVPCRQRLNDTFQGASEQQETRVLDGEDFRSGPNSGTPGDDEDGWIKTANLAASQERRGRDVKTLDESGNLGEIELDESDNIPDMDDEYDPESLTPEKLSEQESKHRTYDIYISYSAFDRTPRMYLSGKDSAKQPLPPNLMMEDIMGDYREKTVTLENFPHEEGVKAVSIHPCRHAAVMKTLMARANNALKLRREKQKLVHDADNRQALGGLSGDMNKLNLAGGTRNESKGNAEDEWEVVETNDNPDEDEVAIRVDQYLVVFLKFMASVIPNVEIDNTTSI